MIGALEMSSGYWFVLYTLPSSTLSFADPSSRKKLSQAEASQKNNHHSNILLYAEGVVLKIYVCSVVMGFILEALGDLAILKNLDVKSEEFNCDRMTHSLFPNLFVL